MSAFDKIGNQMYSLIKEGKIQFDGWVMDEDDSNLYTKDKISVGDTIQIGSRRELFISTPEGWSSPTYKGRKPRVIFDDGFVVVRDQKTHYVVQAKDGTLRLVAKELCRKKIT